MERIKIVSPGLFHTFDISKALKKWDEWRELSAMTATLVPCDPPAMDNHVSPGTICVIPIQKAIQKNLFESRLTKIHTKVSHLPKHFPWTDFGEQELS